MSNPLISIVCVSLDNPTYLDLMLKGLKRNTVNTFEVLVHGNMVGEEFNAVVEKYKSIVSVYTKSDKNLAISAPANALFKQAKGKYFHFMDDDIYPTPGWDEALLKKVKPDMLYQYLCSVIYSYPTAHPETRGAAFNEHDYGDTPETFQEDAFNLTWKDNRTVLKDTAYYPTEGIFVKRELWEEMGGFNEAIQIGGAGIFMTNMYKKAAREQQPIEYRVVADSCIYHFGHVGSVKSAAKAISKVDGVIRGHFRDTWPKILRLGLVD